MKKDQSTNSLYSPANIFAIIIFLSFLAAIIIQQDPDLGWHIRSGQWIWENKQLQHFDTFSFTMANHRWVNHEWLFDIIAYLTYYTKIDWVLALFFSILSAIPFIYYLRKSRSLAHYFIIILLAVGLFPYLAVRPQLFSFILFFLLTILLKHYFDSQKKFLFTALLILLFFVWANLHAGFVAGLIYFIINIFTDYLSKRHQPNSSKSLISNAFVLILCCLIPLINPYGFELYLEIYQVALSADTARFIAEWQPAFAFLDFATPIIAAITIIATIKYYSQIPPKLTLPATIFFLLFLKSNRQYSFFILTALPFLFAVIELAICQIQTNNQNHPPQKNFLQNIFFAKYLLIFLLFSLLTWQLINLSPPKYPEQALQYLKLLNQTNPIGNLYHPYGWGGYIILNAPEIPVFIDGRMPHWNDPDNSAMKDYININRSDSNLWQSIFSKYNIQYALLPNHTSYRPIIFPQNWLNQLIKIIYPPDSNLGGQLSASDWKIIYQDNTAIIYQKTD